MLKCHTFPVSLVLTLKRKKPYTGARKSQMIRHSIISELAKYISKEEFANHVKPFRDHKQMNNTNLSINYMCP